MRLVPKFEVCTDVHERSHPPKTAHSHASHPLVTPEDILGECVLGGPSQRHLVPHGPVASQAPRQQGGIHMVASREQTVQLAAGLLAC